MIIGKESPDSGVVKLVESAKIGYMEQEIHFEYPNKTILETFKEKYIYTELEARNKLARFLFYSDDVFKKVLNLSGGEKVRLSLCMMMEEEINFLILDEPTNHVDIDSREMIEQSLRNFDGTILFISHDRYFINQLATKVIRVEDQKIKTFSGDYKYYREELLKSQLIKAVETKNIVKKSVEYKEKTNKANTNIFKQKEIEQLEKNIEEKEKEIEVLTNELEKTIDYDQLIKKQETIDFLKEELEIILEKWMEFQ